MTPSVQFFLEFRDSGGKVEGGGTLAYKNRKNDRNLPTGFGLGTPLPLETSAVLSQIGDEEKRDES